MKLLLILFINITFLNANNNFFIENQGQKNSDVLYFSELNNTNVFIKNDGIYFDFYQLEKSESNNFIKNGHLVKMEFLGSKALEQFIFNESGKVNYILGNDKLKWKKNLTTSDNVILKNVYENIDVKLYYDKNTLRYDFIVKKGANPDNIKIRFNEVYDLKANHKEFKGQISVGEFINEGLFAYQKSSNSSKQEITCKFNKIDKNTLAFEIGDYDKSKTLIIDPIIYTSFLGWGGNEEVKCIKNINENRYIVAGSTLSNDFPVTEGAYQEFIEESRNIFIAEYQREGIFHSFVRGTYLGGNDVDNGNKLKLDNAGNIFICGNTKSFSFPTEGPIKTSHSGKTDGFIASLSPDLTELRYSYFVGSDEDEDILDIEIKNDKLFFSGYSSSTNLNTKNALQANWRGGKDGILGSNNKFGTSLNFLTYWGGTGDDEITGIEVNNLEDIFWIGSTNSFDYPTHPDISNDNKAPGDNFDIVMGKFRSQLDEVLLSTHLGGTGNDFGVDLINISGNEVYFIGYSEKESTKTIPTNSDSYQEFNAGGFDFLFGLRRDEDLLNLTFIGGKRDDIPHHLQSFGPTGDILILGETASNDFPLFTNAENSNIQFNKNKDGIICVLDKQLKTIDYSTFIGGENDDVIYDGDILNDGAIRFAGTTNSNNFKLIGKPIKNNRNNSGGFVGVTNFGSMQMQNPNGGFDYCPEVVLPIIFSYINLDDENNVNIYLSNDSLEIFELLVENYDDTRFEWKIPKDIEPDKNYKIVVTHNSGVFVESELTFGINPAPKITDFVLSQEDNKPCVGDEIKLFVNYFDVETPIFNWYKNDELIEENESSTFSLNELTIEDSGTYKVAVQGDCLPNAISEEIEIEVIPTTIVISQSQSMKINMDSKLELEVEAEGSDLEYQWYLNNSPLTGETNNKLIVDNVSKTDEGEYYCEISGKCGENVKTEIISIEISINSISNSHKFKKIYFNNNKISFLYNSNSTLKTNLKIIDINGKEVKEIDINLLKGQNRFEFPINLKSGVYFLTIFERDTQSTFKFAVTE